MMASLLAVVGLIPGLVAGAHPPASGPNPPPIPGPDQTGLTVHPLPSTHQPAGVSLRVLAPVPPPSTSPLPLVLILPVEKRNEHRYGDGIQEIRRRGLHQRYPAVYAEPTFAQLPWYANHPTDPTIAQERHLIEVVLPFLAKTYPQCVTKPHLVGFSKSGWGAMSLMLRHPDRFDKAILFDAPLMMDRPGLYGSGPIFADAKNFAAYRLSNLWDRADPSFRERSRLIVLGYGNFRAEHQKAHDRLNHLGIQHEYRDGPKRSHDWHSGWVEEGLALLWQRSTP